MKIGPGGLEMRGAGVAESADARDSKYSVPDRIAGSYGHVSAFIHRKPAFIGIDKH